MNRQDRRKQAKQTKGGGRASKAASHVFRGEQLAGMGEVDGAIKAFRRAIFINPQNADAHYNLGVLLRNQGHLNDAVENYIKVTAIQPDYINAHYNLGNILKELGRLEEAASSYQTVLSIQGDHIDARNNLGTVLQDLGRPEDALAIYHSALEIKPEYAEGLTNFGNALQDLGRFEESITSYTKALKIQPGNARTHCNLGKAYEELGQLNEAIKSLRMALSLTPNYAEAHCNLGAVYKGMGQVEKSVKSFRNAVGVEPKHAESHNNLALALFQLGNIKEGWEEYKWRRKSSTYNSKTRTFPQPHWDGTPLTDKKILLWGEQGLGDEIRYASMIPDLLNAGANISIECEKRLVDLFTRSFVGTDVHAAPYVTAESGEIKYDYQCSFPDLGQFLRPSIECFHPASNAYLFADPELKSLWKKRLLKLSDRPKIGIIWRGGISNREHSAFYATIKELEPVLTIPEVNFINLMYEECEMERNEALYLYNTEIHTWSDLDLKNDQDSLAALISCLDLVICCLSAPGELAGALGVPTFNFISDKAHVQMLGTGDNAWHSSIRYFSKELNASWQPVLNDIAVCTKAKCSP